jgi:hypothetical protein
VLGGGRATTGFRYWRIKSQADDKVFTVSQFCVPVVAIARVGPSADLVLSNSAAVSSLQGGGEPALSLAGTSAYTAELFVRIAGDRLLLQAGVAPPSGKRALDSDAITVAQAIGTPVLGFGLRQYGHGLEFGGAATFAQPLSPVTMLSIGTGGVARGSYDLLAGAPEYRPASEWAFTLGLDLGPVADDSEQRPVRLDANYRTYGADQVGGTPIFQEGDQVEFQVQARSAGAGWTVRGLARAALKARNSILGLNGGTIGQLKSNSGNGYYIRLGTNAPAKHRMRWGFDGELDNISGSDAIGRNGTVFGLGPFLAIPLGAKASLRLEARYLRGTLDRWTGGERSDLSGLSMSASFRWQPSS